MQRGARTLVGPQTVARCCLRLRVQLSGESCELEIRGAARRHPVLRQARRYGIAQHGIAPRGAAIPRYKHLAAAGEGDDQQTLRGVLQDTPAPANGQARQPASRWTHAAHEYSCDQLYARSVRTGGISAQSAEDPQLAAQSASAPTEVTQRSLTFCAAPARAFTPRCSPRCPRWTWIGTRCRASARSAGCATRARWARARRSARAQ